jgi:predicted Zn-dependent protease
MHLTIQAPINARWTVNGTDPSPVLTREALDRIATMVFELSKGSVQTLQLEHVILTVTRLANNRVMLSDSGQRLTIYFPLRINSRARVEFTTNLVDDAMLRSAIRQLIPLGEAQHGTDNVSQELPLPQQPFVPTKLWHDSTAAAMHSIDRDTIPLLIDKLAASGFKGSSFVGLMARSVYARHLGGLTAYSRETDAECSVSARMPDGTASGWYGQANRDWGKIRPADVVDRAIDMAQRSRGPSAVEPGRRVAVLSPFAVAQAMHVFSGQFDSWDTISQRNTMFAVRDDPKRAHKIGLKVFDERLELISDPGDPEGGYTPFGDMVADRWAMPTQNVKYIEAGYLRELAFSRTDSISYGKPFNQNPHSFRLQGVAGTPLLTIDEMIAKCELGIYVNRFSNVMMIDGPSALETGVTRDGCFLIKNGKIDRPVKNFRFLASPGFFLNQLLAIGKPERVPLGFIPREGPPYNRTWPLRPVIVPPIMVNDFNFNTLIDAV